MDNIGLQLPKLDKFNPLVVSNVVLYFFLKESDEIYNIKINSFF